MTKVAAVIGFRDWGLERLTLSIQSIHASLKGIAHEVVVCDYGSEDAAAVRSAILAAGALCIREETDGVWSRSRALNAGVRATQCDIILATDADMLFTPSALSRVVEEIQINDKQIVILQCRDLPTNHDAAAIVRDGIDWDHFWNISRIRPRWGMGGLVAVTRAQWDRLRGWDERMHTYGGEDIDFAQRCQRSGLRVNWLDEPEVGMFHIWHPSTATAAQRSPAAERAIAHNRAIVASDETTVRNRVSAHYLPENLPPIVTVVLRTSRLEDWSGAPLFDTLFTILTQTVQEIEIILPDGPQEIAALDPRIHAIPLTPRDCAQRGTYTIVGEVGDIWEKTRLERLLDAAKGNTALITDVGSTEIYDDAGIRYAQPPVWDPYHSANSLIRSVLLTGLNSDTSWEDITVAVAESGATRTFVSQVGYCSMLNTSAEEAIGLKRTQHTRDGIRRLRLAGIEIEETPALDKACIPADAFLSRDGVSHSGRLVGALSHVTKAGQNLLKTLRSDQCAVLTMSDIDGIQLSTEVVLTGLSSREFLTASSIARTHGTLLVPSGEQFETYNLNVLINAYEVVYGDQSEGWWLVLECETVRDTSEAVKHMRKMPRLAVALGRIIAVEKESYPIALARTTSSSRSDAFTLACSLTSFGNVTLVSGKAEHNEN